MSVSKPKGDVTRNAVVVATRVIADATEKCFVMIAAILAGEAVNGDICIHRSFLSTFGADLQPVGL